MIGELVLEVFKYSNVELSTGVYASADRVSVEKGVIKNIESGNISVDGTTFSFSCNTHVIPNGLSINLYNCPQDINGQTLITQFIDLIEGDIAHTEEK